MRHVVDAVAVAPGRRAWSTSWVDFVELTKPRLTALVVVVAVAGAWIAAPGAVHLALLLHLAAGIGLVVGGANALNMVIERDLDARMERTRNRPLPAGRIGAAGAACFGIAAAAVGAAWLVWATTPAAAVVAT
ncbi:MAG: UbiA family prenyltransferase, partial [Planctomycetota bacterium]